MKPETLDIWGDTFGGSEPPKSVMDPESVTPTGDTFSPDDTSMTVVGREVSPLRPAKSCESHPLDDSSDTFYLSTVTQQENEKKGGISSTKYVYIKKVDKKCHLSPGPETRQTPFEPTPYPYQTLGAVQAAWHGHTLLADEPGLGKTIQALLAARLITPQPRRALIIAPPILITNWKLETLRSRNTNHVTVIDSKTTTPDALPDTGYVITSDALIVARPALADLIATWQPDLLIVDEAHRFKNHRAKRTRTLTTIAHAAKTTILITGTPIISSPLDVLPLLRILGKTRHFPRNFIDYYTKQNFWGDREPRAERLPELHALLEQHVWTRRTKTQVLPDLPAKHRTNHTVTVESADLDEAMTDLYEQIDELKASQVEAWAADAITKIARLRRATGLAKISAATDWATTHLDGTTDRPLIVWAIHRDVITTLADNIRVCCGFG